MLRRLGRAVESPSLDNPQALVSASSLAVSEDESGAIDTVIITWA